MKPDYLLGKTCLFAVAQEHFHTSDSCFSTLLPLLVQIDRETWERADPHEFPSKADVWWRLLPKHETEETALPGRLLRAELERSILADQPGRAYFQVRTDTITVAHEYADIVELTEPLHTDRQLVSPSFSVTLDHPPQSQIYVCSEQSVYGPFKPAIRADFGDSQQFGNYRVALKPVDIGGKVTKIDAAKLKGHIIELEAQISVSNMPVYENGVRHACEYRLCTQRELKQLSVNAPTVTLLTDAELVRRVAKDLLIRRKYVEMAALLEELQPLMDAEHRSEPELRALDELLNQANVAVEDARQLADALVKSDTLRDQIEESVSKRARELLEERAEQVRNEVTQATLAEQKQLDELRLQIRTERDKWEKDRSIKEQELEMRRQESQKKTREEEVRIEAAKKDLEDFQGVLAERLETVTSKFATEREHFLEQILVMLPLIGHGQGLPVPASIGENGDGPRHQPLPLTLLPFATRRTQTTGGFELQESAFFERFHTHVRNCGFTYRDIDLKAFHLSTKCNDMTILGGIPGTGKSSLPRLYSEALRGEESMAGGLFLNIGVSPSWMDMRDLLGYVNALKDEFQPSDSGLYEFLIACQEEYETHRGGSFMHIVCLDEMNLAQVEHYFSGFLQALEKPEEKRVVTCFQKRQVATDSPFVRWSDVSIVPSLRFAGTVNFDETTRKLSHRMLDRSNLIRLRPERHDAAISGGGTRPSAAGPAVTLSCFEQWCMKGSIDTETVQILDEIAKPLTLLGCSLNQRKSQAIRRFLMSAPPELCSPRTALDLQIAHRLLPQVRGLFRVQASNALNELRKILETRAGFEESLAIIRDIMSEQDYRAYPEGE